MVNSERALIREAANTLEGILSGSLGIRIRPMPLRKAADQRYDIFIEADTDAGKFRFAVEAKGRITPQTVLSVARRLHGLPKRLIPLIYAPVVSPRVAAILTEEEIGYFDRAGNCRLRSRKPQLLIERRGFDAERVPTPAAANPFSPKSSRIVRAMLSLPDKGWQVRKLAELPEAGVSPGLVVKVKRALIEEGYAIERQRLLYLRDPEGLLKAWTAKYPGPAEQISFYFRGDVTAEQALDKWCKQNQLNHALAGFTAAWRLAPEVRHNVFTVYIEDRGFEKAVLDRLTTDHGGKRVESGGNLTLWRPFDASVFAFGRPPAGVTVTSPLQTYLDLIRTPGRGEDAASAIHKTYMDREFRAVAERAKEWSHGEH